MGLGDLRSTTIMGNEVVDATQMNTLKYQKDLEIEQQQKEVDPGIGIAGKQPKHQEIKRIPPKHVNPVVPERGGMKQAAEAVQEANRKALADRGISVEPTDDPPAKPKRKTKTKTTD